MCIRKSVHKEYDKIHSWFDKARTKTLFEKFYLDYILEKIPVQS